MAEPTQCIAQTASGSQCKNAATEGEYCATHARMHSAEAELARREEEIARREAEADRKIAEAMAQGGTPPFPDPPGMGDSGPQREEIPVVTVVAPLATGEVEAGNPEESVTFNSGQHPSLRQVIRDGRTIQFRGGLFTTKDKLIIRQMRAIIDNPKVTAKFFEDDPVEIYRCPFCKFTSPKLANVRTHARQRHPGKQALL